MYIKISYTEKLKDYLWLQKMIFHFGKNLTNVFVEVSSFNFIYFSWI